MDYEKQVLNKVAQELFGDDFEMLGHEEQTICYLYARDHGFI